MADTTNRVSDAEVKKATGKTWSEWFTILDKAGARVGKTDDAFGFNTRILGGASQFRQLISTDFHDLIPLIVEIGHPQL